MFYLLVAMFGSMHLSSGRMRSVMVLVDSGGSALCHAADVRSAFRPETTGYSSKSRRLGHLS
eukprot:14514762-Alexandrium_andersonii.AAC.1